MKIILLSLLIALFYSTQVLAWGGRGHHTICETAVFLTEEKDLKNLLKSKPEIMGHLCNIPDIYWKTVSKEMNNLGSPSHFLDPEITGLKIKNIGTNFDEIVKTYTGKPNQHKEGTIFSVPTEFGSVWWRADQFFRKIISLEKNFAQPLFPTNSKQEQDENLQYNKDVYEMIVNMGLMGHFIGDASQPLHNTSNYDGYDNGHGGIHSFYEETLVSMFEGNLAVLVYEKAKKMKKIKKQTSFLQKDTVLENMKELTIVSLNDLEDIFKNDPILKPSELKKEKGMSLKTPAERKSPEVMFKKLSPMIITELSRASLLLSHSWDEAYRKIGKPNLKPYKLFKYPFTPEFVAPDYFDHSLVEKKK